MRLNATFGAEVSALESGRSLTGKMLLPSSRRKLGRNGMTRNSDNLA